MIKEINISNFVITDKVNIDFNKGFTSMTGETGAGKSIILKALSVLTGERVSSEVIKHGEKKSDLSATFDISNLIEIKEKLKDLDLINEENEDELLIRKVITSSERKSYINDIKVNINTLKDITNGLINMHNQKEHLNILKKDYQLYLLDSYVNKEKIKNNVFDLCNEVIKKSKKLKSLKEEKDKNKERIDVINFQLEKLKGLNLGKDEYKELEERNNEIENANEYRNNLAEILDILFEREDSVMSLLGVVSNKIPETDSMRDTEELINQSLINIKESKQDISSLLNNLDFDEDEVEKIEEKISEINAICKMLNLIPEDIPERISELEKELSEISFSDDDLLLLEKDIERTMKEYHKYAEELNLEREKVKEELEKNINKYLEKLNIRENAFKVKINTNKDKININGYDDVDFLFSPNLGTPYYDLSKIASGGELSRVSLAIQLALSNKINFNTMIFDEIDTGVGGQTAAEIGLMLKELGKNTQVICITHQPQVASKAKMHILINKYEKNNKTIHEMCYIDGDNRIKEIARMLSSEKTTNESFDYAKVLLE